MPPECPSCGRNRMRNPCEHCGHVEGDKAQRMDGTDFADPSTIDVDEVIANISRDYLTRGDCWTDRLSWPNVTVKALADEVTRLREDNKSLRKLLRDDVYPSIASRVIHLRDAGETVAMEQWNGLCQRVFRHLSGERSDG